MQIRFFFSSLFLFPLLSATPLPPGSILHTETNIEGGKKLILNDRSCWEIRPEDVSACRLWLSPFPVKIVFTGRGDYPYFLVNIQSGEKVQAKPSSER